MKTISYSFVLLKNQNFALFLDHDEVQNNFEGGLSGVLNTSKKQFLLKTIRGNFILQNIEENVLHYLKDTTSPYYQSLLIFILDNHGPKQQIELKYTVI